MDLKNEGEQASNGQHQFLTKSKFLSYFDSFGMALNFSSWYHLFRDSSGVDAANTSVDSGYCKAMTNCLLQGAKEGVLENDNCYRKRNGLNFV